MKNPRSLLIGLAVLALGAGLAAGILAARLPAGGRELGVEGPERSPMEEELGLSADQRDKMHNIWERARDRVQDHFREIQDLQRKRDNAIQQILTPEQKTQFEKIASNFKQQEADLGRKREEEFAAAVEKTKAILDEHQRRKYEQIIKNRMGHLPTTGPAGMMNANPAAGDR